MVRTKLVAVLLGPTGIGLIGLYTSAVELVFSLSNFGIASSGVREVTIANGENDKQRVAATILTLRRACWVTGILGWLITACVAWPLTQWIFGSTEKSWAVALLGVTLLVRAITGGQSALIQGMRRIGDLARMSIINSIAGTLVAVAVYSIWKEKGIVPVMIATSVTSLGVSWWFARRIDVEDCVLSWGESIRKSKDLLTLGFAFMWGGLMAALSALVLRSLIIQELGLEENGIYQAAWGISGMFAGFILSAMGSDFYPHLTSIIKEHSRANQLVNEQIEIGLLLAVPGIIGTLVFAPLIIEVFYTKAFIAGAELLPWFVFGIFARVISWPLGFLILAKGATRWFLFTQTHFNVILIFFVWYLLPRFGLEGTAIALALTYIPAGVANLIIAHRLTKFRWSRSVVKLLGISGMLVGLGYVCSLLVPEVWCFVVGSALVLASGVISLRGIVARLDTEHRIVKLAGKLPFAKLICGI